MRKKRGRARKEKNLTDWVGGEDLTLHGALEKARRFFKDRVKKFPAEEDNLLTSLHHVQTWLEKLYAKDFCITKRW